MITGAVARGVTSLIGDVFTKTSDTNPFGAITVIFAFIGDLKDLTDPLGTDLSIGTIADDEALDAGVGSEVAVILIGGGTFAVVATTALGRGDTGPVAGDLSRPTTGPDVALILIDGAGPVGTANFRAGTTGLGTTAVRIHTCLSRTGITRASEIIFIRVRGTGPFAQDLSSNAFFSRDTGVGAADITPFIDTGAFIVIGTTFSQTGISGDTGAGVTTFNKISLTRTHTLGRDTGAVIVAVLRRCTPLDWTTRRIDGGPQKRVGTTIRLIGSAVIVIIGVTGIA